VAIINRLFWAVFGGFLGEKGEKGEGSYSLYHYLVGGFGYLFVFINPFTF